jgi:TonB family protein
MPSQQPLYRRSSTALGGYTLRLLLGWTLSLGGIVLLLQLPLTTPSPRVGWTTHSGTERIPLSELRANDPASTSSTPAAEDGLPPPTRHASPAPAPVSTSSGPGGDAESDSPTNEEPEPSGDSSSVVRPVASLSARDRLPEVLGGAGALRLHIPYPAAAQNQGIEGQLVLAFTVDTGGRTQNIEVVKSLHPLCDSAAVKGLRSVRFRPGTDEGEVVPVRMSLPIRFQLQPGPSPRTKAASTRRGS